MGADLPSPAVARFHRFTYGDPTHLTVGPQPHPRLSFSHYDSVMLQSAGPKLDKARVAAIKAENPGCKVLCYIDPLYYRPLNADGSQQGCAPAITNANEAWFLHDQHGARIQAKAYAGNYLLDYGNADYQAAVIPHVTAVMRASGFDGVFFDDFTANIGWSLATGVLCPQYPPSGIARWQAAVTSFAAAVGPALKAEGLIVVANAGGCYVYPSANLWPAWGKYLDGLEEESWMDVGAGVAANTWAFKAQLAQIMWAEANGKTALCIGWSATRTNKVFGLAAMLLAANGNCRYSTQNQNAWGNEVWYPEYDKAIALGAPLGAYTVSGGLYSRSFQHGTVKVNTTGSVAGGVAADSALIA